MDATFVTTMIFETLGGLGVFLLGMKNMSEGMQAIAGPRLRKMIGLGTNNRIAGAGLGTAVTMLVQSSSVTTVMVVGLVNVGLMTLQQSIGVILGANIGTTITGWILVLKIGKYGLPIIGVSAIFYLFSRNDRLRFFGMFALGLGMVFFGLELMKDGFKPLRGQEQFIEWFSHFSPETYFGVLRCCLVGALLTAIVQSSSATLGITIALATGGVIDFHTAAALVLGENIGTTVTAWLASIGASVNAKRASLAHICVNLLGVAWITAVFPLYAKIVLSVSGVDPGAMSIVDGAEIYPQVGRAIALAHTGFNVTNVIIFLPLVGVLARFLTRVVPDREVPEVSHLLHLDVRMLDTPSIGIVQSRNEVLRMGRDSENMLVWLREAIEQRDEIDEEGYQKIFHREEVLDVLQKEIVEFLSEMLEGNVTHDIVEEGRRQIRMADEYESISDYIVNVFKLKLKMSKEDLRMADQGLVELLDLHDHVADYLKLVTDGLAQDHPEVISEAKIMGDQVTHLMKDYRTNHLERVGTEHATPQESLAFTDMLNAYRRIKDHALNIAEALAGEK